MSGRPTLRGGPAQPGRAGRGAQPGRAAQPARAERAARTPPPPSELVELEVGAVAHHGLCVARADGRVVFVRHALPGERVRARITDVSHDRYWRADAVEVLVASPDRVEPPCPHARPGLCGGCDWQHASLDAQRRLKARVVEDSLRRIAGLDLTVLVEALTSAAPDGLGWRTRMRFSRTPDGGVGLRAHRSHRVVATPDCRIADPLLASVIADPSFLQGPASPDRTGQAVELVAMPASPPDGEPGAVAYSTRSGRWQVVQVPAGEGGAEPEGQRSDSPPPEAEVQVVETVEGRRFHLEPGVFWQVHPTAAATLVAAVRDAAGAAPGDTALDLYSGAGLFAAFLAAAVGPTGQVIAVESDEAAVRSAARSLADLPWVSLRALRVTPATVSRLTGGSARPGIDVAVLDPPRTGAGREVMTALLAHRPRRVVYVACDPAALGRDVAVAAGEGYRLTGLRAFDIFPMTSHVECVAILEPTSASDPAQAGAVAGEHTGDAGQGVRGFALQ